MSDISIPVNPLPPPPVPVEPIPTTIGAAGGGDQTLPPGILPPPYNELAGDDLGCGATIGNWDGANGLDDDPYLSSQWSPTPSPWDCGQHFECVTLSESLAIPWCIVQIPDGMAEGDWVNAGCYVRADAACTVRQGFAWYDGGSGWLAGSYASTAPHDGLGWQWITFAVQTPANADGAVELQIRPRFDSATSVTTIGWASPRFEQSDRPLTPTFPMGAPV